MRQLPGNKMAQPNAVREPSMDEILASIRRIIESNEPVMQGGIATALAEPEGFSGQPANDDSEAVTLTVDGEFSEADEMPEAVRVAPSMLRAVSEAQVHAEASVMREMRQPAASGASQPAPQKALSLADVAARVRAASERTAAVARELVQTSPENVEPEPAIAAQPYATAQRSEPEVTSRAPVQKENLFTAQPASAAADRVEIEMPVDDGAAMPLLSSGAGEQVARAFQDLAFAVDNAERRSFDEIAEEMLRPMLQEWLDDNLPTLVERLVREEIERVARGPRR
jgi:cell pole-organizing protein PopZ